MADKLINKLLIFLCLLNVSIYGCASQTNGSNLSDNINNENISVVRIADWYEPFPIDEMNQILEEKNYPYRLEFTAIDEGYDDSTELSRSERYQLWKTAFENNDIVLSNNLNSYNKWIVEEDLITPLNRELIDLLPNDMYRKINGNIYEFPSNFYGFDYPVGKSDIYYAIVKNELAEAYQMNTYDDLYTYMIEHDDYSVASDVFQEFRLLNKTDFEIGNWYLGIHWDDENERFYNPYTEETEHLELYKHIFNDVQSSSDYFDGADIIFGSELIDGYTGIEYQPYVFNEFNIMGYLFSKNCNEYAQQFICDLYTDPDLTNAALVDGWGLDFGNLELLDQETLKEYYDIESFDYEEFTDSLSSKKSKLFDSQIYLSDAASQEQIFELMTHGTTQSLGVANGKQERIDEIIATQPDYQDEIISKLNDIYQQSLEN